MTNPRTRTAARTAAGLISLLVLVALTAGLPAALYAVGGSPIPHAIPSWHHVTVTLTRPDHGTLLLAAIRWISWLAWAAFTISALAEVFSQVRGRSAPRLPVLSPVQGLAAALVGTALLGLLPGPHPPRPAAPLHRPAQAAAAAPPRPGQPTWATAPTAATSPLSLSVRTDRVASPAAVAHRERYRVVEGDNLWDIAARRLGDGERWHEIYALNRGRPQPGGGSLTDPSLIYPGWILLLPTHTAHERSPSHYQAAQTHPGPPLGPEPAVNGGPHPGQSAHRLARPHHSGSPRPSRPPAPAPGRQRPPAIPLPSGGLAGITLAAAISTALVAWRLHRRRAAVPRWPIPDDRAEPPVPETISVLRRAHLRSLAADAAEARGEPWPDDIGPPTPGDTGDGQDLDEFGAPTGPAWQPATSLPGDGQHQPAPQPQASPAAASGPGADGPLPAPAPSPAPVPATGAGPGPGADGQPADAATWLPVPPARPLPAGSVVFGTRGSSEIPLTEVARPGLGLTGPGAHAVARALMTGLLAAPAPGSRHPGGQVIIPAADARQLTENHLVAQVPGVAPGLPDGLTVTPSLAAALDLIETQVTSRLREHDTGHDDPASPGARAAGGTGLAPLALIATADPATAPRVQAALAAGTSTGITGILLGHWPTGTTCHIGAGGVVLAAADPALAGVQACHLPAADTAAMLSLLRGAQGHLNPDQPHPPPAHGPDPAPEPKPGRAPQQFTGGGSSAPGGTQNLRRDATGRPPDVPYPYGDLVQPASRPPATPPADGKPAGHSDAAPQSQAAASTALTAAATPSSSRVVEISVLGPPRITTSRGREISGGLRKARELLAYLAVHPEGVTGEGISADLWPESSPRYAASQRKLALRKAREMLRAATGLPAPLFITLTGDRYRLDPALIDVDLWQFDTALDRARQAGSDQDQLTALRQATALYQGPLADGAGYEWAEHHAEPLRRHAVDALARIAAILTPHDPEQALTTLENALAHDPYNEALYQEVMRIQTHLGRPDAAHRTLALLQTRLAGLGLSPAPATRQAAGIAPGHPPAAPLPCVGYRRQESQPSYGGKRTRH